MPRSAQPRRVESEPVQIKLYGFITVTKRSYLTRLAVGLFFAVVLVVGRLWLPVPRAHHGWADVPVHLFLSYWLLENLEWIILATLLLAAVEAIFVLRRFKREEALRRALLSETQPRQ